MKYTRKGAHQRRKELAQQRRAEQKRKTDLLWKKFNDITLAAFSGELTANIFKTNILFSIINKQG